MTQDCITIVVHLVGLYKRRPLGILVYRAHHLQHAADLANPHHPASKLQVTK
ncbi:hypothetical protein BDV30DRAFT_216922 [Aspergillus minisclerotigenes]|uniref:Uncharacterized protein n=1 Tax=Aspergillus minisclerotigenes TaxID=656917 RepID=A0A5N6ITC4_9EURO|nr:hypothetical protein BDV30DRAFT_216922 [Aspergillus minisclerotigenes]